MTTVSRFPGVILSCVALCAMLFVYSGCRKQVKESVAPRVVNERAKQVFDGLKSAWSGVDAFYLDILTEARRDIGDRASSKGMGNYRFQKLDGEEYIHYVVASRINIWMGDETYHATELVRFVSDGRILTKGTFQPQHREVLRTPYSPEKVLHLGGDYLYKLLLSEYELEVTGEEEYEGREVVLIRAVPLAGEGYSFYHFDKASGILMRHYEHNAEEELIYLIENTNLNLSPGFTDQDFTYTPPEDATIIDETGPERIVVPYVPVEEEQVNEVPSHDDTLFDQPEQE